MIVKRNDSASVKICRGNVCLEATGENGRLLIGAAVVLMLAWAASEFVKAMK